MRATKRNLLKIATSVRAQAEAKAEDAGFPSNLRRFCILGARLIFSALRREGLRPVFAVKKQARRKNHCFIVCGKYVVDVTATQFGENEVCVVPLEEARSRWYWDPHLTFRSLSGLLRFMRREECPENYLLLRKAQFYEDRDDGSPLTTSLQA